MPVKDLFKEFESKRKYTPDEIIAAAKRIEKVLKFAIKEAKNNQWAWYSGLTICMDDLMKTLEKEK